MAVLSISGGDRQRHFVHYGHVRNRLRQIREHQELTLEEVASQWRIIMPEVKPLKPTAKSIARLETDERQLKYDQARKFSLIYKIDLEDISGEDGDKVTVPIVGYVGAGEVVRTFDDQEPRDWVTPPKRPGAELTSAVIVRGDSMWPAYKPGDLLFYFPSDIVAPNALGQDCVIRLVNGDMYVKTLKPGTAPGLYRLVSCRSSMPDIDDVEVQWAAKIRWMERR